jgi:hypothetical protein
MPETYDIVDAFDRHEAFRNRALSSLPVVGSMAAFLIVLSKILLVSGGDIGTALALVDRAGPFPVLAGSFLAISPFFAVGLIGAVGQGIDRATPPQELQTVYIVFIILLFWLSFIVPFTSLAFVVAYAVATEITRRRKKRKSRSPGTVSSWDEILQLPVPRDEQLLRLIFKIHECETSPLKDRKIVDLAALQQLKANQADYIEQFNQRLSVIRQRARRPLDAVAIGFLLFALLPVLPNILSDIPWLPAEVVELEDGSFETGYVLDLDDRWLVLLTEDGRRVQTFDANTVEARAICSPDGASGKPTRTIWRLTAGIDEKYAPCPSDDAG